jgi:hypothetical protein
MPLASAARGFQSVSVPVAIPVLTPERSDSIDALTGRSRFESWRRCPPSVRRHRCELALSTPRAGKRPRGGQSQGTPAGRSTDSRTRLRSGRRPLGSAWQGSAGGAKGRHSHGYQRPNSGRAKGLSDGNAGATAAVFRSGDRSATGCRKGGASALLVLRDQRFDRLEDARWRLLLLEELCAQPIERLERFLTDGRVLPGRSRRTWDRSPQCRPRIRASRQLRTHPSGNQPAP